MGSSGGIRAGKAFVETYADNTRLGSGLRQAEQLVSGFGTKIGGIGKSIIAGFSAAVGSGGPLTLAVTEFASMGSELHDMSQRTGASVEALSTLGYVAQQSGVEAGGLETGFKKMAKNLAEAAGGSQEARDSLAGLGLSLGDLASLKPDEQFRMIGDRISQISNPTEKAAAAMKIFGKSGMDLIPMFEGGAEGMREYEAQARRLGLEFTNADADGADALGDSLDTLWAQLKMGAAQIGAALAPALMELTGAASNFLSQAISWVRENRELIATIAKVAAGVGIAGAAIAALGAAIGAAGSLYGIAAGVIGFFATSVGALVSPVGLAIAAVTALGAYLLYSSELGQQALTWLGEQFIWLKDEALGAWEGISDALAAGDLALAGKIAWAALKSVFLEGTHTVRSMWTDLTYSLSSVLIDAMSGLEAVWLETTDFFADAWRVVCDGIAGAWDSTVGFVQKLWVRLKSLLGQKVNVAGEVQAIDDANASAARQREDARDKEIGDRDKARRGKREQIEKDRQGAQQQLGSDRESAQDALFDEEKQAREELESLKAEAKAKREGLPAPGEKPTGAPELSELDISAKAKELKKGISGEDIRTSGGAKALLDSLRSANDPAKETAATLKGIASVQQRQWQDGRASLQVLQNGLAPRSLK